MFVSLIAFSQKDTKNTTDSSICLPKQVAIEVVKDIIKKDSCETEIKIIKNNYNLLEKNNIFKDSVINSKENRILLYQEKEKNYETIISFKDTQKENLEGAIKSLNDELTKTKRELKKTKVIASGIILFLTYIIFR